MQTALVRMPTATEAAKAPYVQGMIHYHDNCGAFRIVLERGRWSRLVRRPWRWRVEGCGWTPRPNPISDQFGWTWRPVLRYVGVGIARDAVPCSGRARTWVDAHRAAMAYLDDLAPELSYALDRNVRTITRDGRA